MWYQGASGYLLPGVIHAVRGDNVSLQNEWDPMSEVCQCTVCVCTCAVHIPHHTPSY